MTHSFLIATVGGAPEPLAASLLHWRPARVLFVVSGETKGLVASQIVPLVRDRDWKDFDDGRYDLIEVLDAQDFKSIVATLHRLDERIDDWLCDHPDSNVIVDFTGGTKAMTAGLVLFAARWSCRISYVGGKARDKNGVGKVLPGEEQVVYCENPWDALGYLAVEQAIVLFDKGDYSAAAQLVENTRNRIADESRKREFEAFTLLCQAFECWERFQHGEALVKVRLLRKGTNDLSALLGSRRAGAILSWLDQAKGDLKQLATPSADATTLLALVRDLFSNALRRYRQGRYDDAVARLYRAIEALAQAKLHEHGFADTSKVPLEQVPEPLRTRWQSCARDGHLKLGLQDDYALLEALGNEAAHRFNELRLGDPKHSLLVARNSSILAHGYAPVSKDAAKELFAAALKLANLTKNDLTLFPTFKLNPQPT